MHAMTLSGYRCCTNAHTGSHNTTPTFQQRNHYHTTQQCQTKQKKLIANINRSSCVFWEWWCIYIFFFTEYLLIYYMHRLIPCALTGWLVWTRRHCEFHMSDIHLTCTLILWRRSSTLTFSKRVVIPPWPAAPYGDVNQRKCTVLWKIIYTTHNKPQLHVKASCHVK